MFILKYQWNDNEYSVEQFNYYRVTKRDKDGDEFAVTGYREDGTECMHSMLPGCVMYVANSDGKTVDVIRGTALLTPTKAYKLD